MFLNQKYTQLTTKELKPKGWALKQLKLQANGLSGHLQECWPDIAQSQWIGGDREGWERVPYWLDGFIPMAYLLEDEELIAVAKKYVDFILEKQVENEDSMIWDGWICPVKSEMEFEYFDEWAVILICKALIVYYDCSGDERIPDVVYKILKNLKYRLEHFAIKSWGSYRWYEGLISIYWMYDRTGEDWLLKLAKLMWEQSADLEKSFKDWEGKDVFPTWTLYTHVVNLAMALKCEPLFEPLHKMLGYESTGADFAEMMYQNLTKYHGNAFGHFTGDECISGTSPVHGTELCGVVEAMYSYEWIFAVTGDTKWLDRCDDLALNGLPAGLTEDMWARQYNQMTNQIYCGQYEEENRPFLTNGYDGSLFGLESNYGCCTANFSQGWPKYILSAFMRSDRGLACGTLMPSEVNLEIKGAKVKCTLETDYPFKNILKYTIETDRPVEFDFDIRIPNVMEKATVDGKEVKCGMNPVSKTWEGKTEIIVEMTPRVEFTKRPNDMYALKRGSLVFSLPIEEKWERYEYIDQGIERKYPYCDYLLTPESEWQYEFANTNVKFTECDGWEVPYTKANPPIYCEVEMYPVNWGYKDKFDKKVAREEPLDRTPAGDKKVMKLLPYGIPKLRMTEMPIADKE